MKYSFDFYGLTVEVHSAEEELIEEIRRDFAYFLIPPKKCQVQIDLHLTTPPYDDLPSLSASFFTPRNVCFKGGNKTYIDYFGKGLSIFNRKKQQCTVYGEDIDLVHEICYLFILSISGQYFDKRRIHRIHALAVSKKNRGVLLLLPSRGGKSTIALKLLVQHGYRLLSDDSPLIDHQGDILPFPLRVGVSPESDHEISQKYIRTIKRMEFDPKTLIDVEAFQDRLGEKVGSEILIVGERNLGTTSEIVQISRFLAFKALVKYMIVGLGIYQGLEFLLERGSWEVFSKFGLVFSRFRNARTLLCRSHCYKFVMGRDIEKNSNRLIEFIDKTL